MTSPLSLTQSRRSDGRLALVVAGEVDMGNAAGFAAAIDERLAAADRLVVDLVRLTYIDSAGLRVLLTRAAQVELVANPIVLPVLTICGLTSLTTVEVVSEPASSDTGAGGSVA
jgi:anti-anti-sigma factor